MVGGDHKYTKHSSRKKLIVRMVENAWSFSLHSPIGFHGCCLSTGTLHVKSSLCLINEAMKHYPIERHGGVEVFFYYS
jgi:hypothetical protein